MSTIDDREDIPPTARLFWVGHYFRILASYTDRYDLECTDGYELFRTLPRSKVRALKHCGDLTIEPHFFDLDGKPAGTNNRAQLLADLSVAEQRVAMVDYILVKELHRARQLKLVMLYETPKKKPKTKRKGRYTGAVTLDVWFAQNQSRLYALCRPYFLLDASAPQMRQEQRKGQPGPPSLGSPSSLKLAYQKFRKKGFSIVDLAPKKDAMRNGGRPMAADVATLCERHMRSYGLTPERMSISALRRDLRAMLNEIPAMRNRRVPSIGALKNLIRDLKDAQVIGALFGIDAMEHQSNIFTKGPEFTRVGEKIIMDCWKIDNVTLVKEGDGWILVNEDLKEEWGVRRRLWVSMAMDACSRVILGMALGFSESTELTRQALRMVISDKSDWAQDAGCAAPSPPPVRPESILTDVGHSFKNPYFAMPALDLTKDVDIGPAGKSHLRGMKERFFKSVKEMLLSYFTGFTFGNIMAKGDYDAMGRASLVDGDLGRGLFLWVNDVYNLSGHRGLDDQPPIDRFNEQYTDYGAFDLPTEEEEKVIFGIDVNLPVTRQGCWFAGNHYWSGALGVHFSQKGRTRLRVKVDPLDLGQLLAWIDGAWVRLAGPAHMRGIGMTAWLATCRALKLKHGAQNAIHYDIVAKALRRLRQMGITARLKANVADMSYDSEAIVKAANRIRIHFVERAKPTTPGALLATDASSREASFDTSGVDVDFDELVAIPVVPDDDEPSVRTETDIGLDDADIDQDGDLLEGIEDDEAPDPAPDTEEPMEDEEPPTPPPPKRPRMQFLTPPTRKD